MTRDEKKRKMYVPDLLYEEGSKIPFVQVPLDKDMPDILHIYEYKLTGEFHPGPDGEDVPHCDVLIHQYFDQEILQKILDEETVNKVRVFAGLEPLETAREKGKKITENVLLNVDDEKKVH